MTRWQVFGGLKDGLLHETRPGRDEEELTHLAIANDYTKLTVRDIDDRNHTMTITITGKEHA